MLSCFEQYHTLLKCLTMIAGTRWQELFLASGWLHVAQSIRFKGRSKGLVFADWLYETPWWCWSVGGNITRLPPSHALSWQINFNALNAGNVCALSKLVLLSRMQRYEWVFGILSLMSGYCWGQFHLNRQRTYTRISGCQLYWIEKGKINKYTINDTKCNY